MFCRTSTPSKRIAMDESAEAVESPNGPVTPGTPSGSAQNGRKINSDGLQLTNSGRVSMTGNKVNEKFNASYRNSENTNRLLGRLLSLGQACGIVGVALFGADIPMEESGIHLHILHILYILIFFGFNAYFAYSVYFFTQKGSVPVAAWLLPTSEICCSNPVIGNLLRERFQKVCNMINRTRMSP